MVIFTNAILECSLYNSTRIFIRQYGLSSYIDKPKATHLLITWKRNNPQTMQFGKHFFDNTHLQLEPTVL